MVEYKVKSGDTVSNIAIEYAVTVSDIEKANLDIFNSTRLAEAEKLGFSRAVDLIYPNEILFIPISNIGKLREENEITTGSLPEGLVVLINGIQCARPTNITIQTHYDSVSDICSLVYPYELNSPVGDAITQPTKLYTLKIYNNKEFVFNGNIEEIVSTITPNGTSVTITGRSITRTLEKSIISPNIPKEYKNKTLEEITRTICNDFGIDVIPSDNEIIELATAEGNDTPYAFLQGLAGVQKKVISNTIDGKIEIKNTIVGTPVFNFIIDKEQVSFLGIDAYTVRFETQNLYGTYIVNNENTDGNSRTLKKSNYIAEKTYKAIENKNGLSPEQLIADYESKTISSLLTQNLNYPSWLNPNTDTLWLVGQYVTVKIPEGMLDDEFIYLITKVEYVQSGNEEYVALELTPPQTFTSERIKINA